jgi:hypothetical protein
MADLTPNLFVDPDSISPASVSYDCTLRPAGFAKSDVFFPFAIELMTRTVLPSIYHDLDSFPAPSASMPTLQTINDAAFPTENAFAVPMAITGLVLQPQSHPTESVVSGAAFDNILIGPPWLRDERAMIKSAAQDWVARQRLAMRSRIRPVIEPLPPMTPTTPPSPPLPPFSSPPAP